MLSVVHAVVVCMSIRLFVCVCVCVSVTLWYCMKMAKGRITSPTIGRDSSFQMRCFVVAEFLLTNVSRTSAIAEPLVNFWGPIYISGQMAEAKALKCCTKGYTILSLAKGMTNHP